MLKVCRFNPIPFNFYVQLKHGIRRLRHGSRCFLKEGNYFQLLFEKLLENKPKNDM